LSRAQTEEFDHRVAVNKLIPLLTTKECSLPFVLQMLDELAQTNYLGDILPLLEDQLRALLFDD
jgi:hypothetical protein